MVFLLGAGRAGWADANTVLIFSFENRSNDRTLDWIGEGIVELIMGRLQPEPGVHVFSREERSAACEKLNIPETAILSRATAFKLGLDNGVDNVIAGSFSGTADDFHIDARLIDLEAGASTDFKADGKLQDIVPLTMTLSWHLLRKIIPGTASPEADYTARPPTPRSAFENYVRALLVQDLQKRIDLLQTAIRLYPQYGPALYQLGRAYHLQREFALSNESLQKLPPASPDHLQALFLTGMNNIYLSDYPAALAAFQQLPQTYDVLLNLGTAFLRKGDFASATSMWRRAATIDPLSNDAYFNLGYASFVRSDFEGAEKNLVESLRLRGRDSEALFLLGKTYEKFGRLDDSRKLIAQAARLSQRVERWQTQPLPKMERFTTSTTFRSHEDVWNDQRLARKARTQDLPAWLEIVQADLDSYLFGDALRDLHDVMRIFPDSAEARSLLAEVDRQRNSR